jgi:flagellin
MGLRINNNIAAQNAYRNLSVSDGDMQKSLEKLSSGFRINRAADDAAGLSISEGLRSQIGGLKVASRNAQDGISVVQTAEGALNETTSILQRMRDLTVQASNGGGLSDDAKSNIKDEMDELGKELTRIADTTQFNGTKLLDGTYKGTFQVGANVGETIDVDVDKSMSAAGLGLGTVDVTTAADAAYVKGLKVGDTAGDTAAVFTSTAAFDDTAAAALKTAANLKINGTAVDLSSSDGTAADVVSKINAAQLGVTASLSGGKLVVTQDTKGAAATATVAGVTGATVAGTDKTMTQTDVDANDALASGADKALKLIDDALKTVTSTRSELGAKQNRFEHTINNLNTSVENLSASESRIRDTDMAQEMVSYTRSQILSQAGTAMLAQAKSSSQGVLQLLQG